MLGRQDVSEQKHWNRWIEEQHNIYQEEVVEGEDGNGCERGDDKGC